MLKRRLFLVVAALFLVFSSSGIAGAESESIVGSEIILYDEMVDILGQLEEQSDGKLDVFTLREIGIEEGRSETGKDLYVAKIGNGDRNIWVQGRIHGNEPYGTNATLRLIENLINEKDVSYKEILEELTVYFIPMYNVDGANRNQRGTILYDHETGEPKLNDRGQTITVDLNRDWVDGGFDAIESVGYYKFWTQIKPEFMMDIHHQGNKNFYGTNIPVTLSLGISLNPGGPTLPNLKGGEYEDLTRQAMVTVFDALKPYKEFTVDQYITGTNVIDIRGGVSSGMMMGINYEGLNEEGHSNPAVFLETSGQFLDGEREPLIQQNIIATHAFLSGLASGELYKADPERWNEVPIRPISGFNTDYQGVIPINPPRPEIPVKVSADHIKALVERYEEIGKFANKGAAQTLKVHATSLKHYEETGQYDKVIKHLDGFNKLIDQQKKTNLMTDGTYQMLKANSDYLKALMEKQKNQAVGGKAG
ncbi:M14 family zinc carboxypeptidase [Siminovitchia fortis]|uniref:Tat (Twin-arginine translocation) pathway signal sequence n=1 Tax=Siminovitchia fortis TaxID=254758 RepID=A0A443IV16_9BACI|nr:M14 family zinc carboxypeptidase [Siminovitchia fortis]RWR11911.1 Tat (twin-arginine translocation) pathway signal sequence [Siminovitchia fortis]WHY80828.1 M14 family zinc carboxypeptidase [Siminovitchia fortis]